MRLLTLNINSHSSKHEKEEYKRIIHEFADYVADEDIELFAIQECSQTHNEDVVDEKKLKNFVASDNQVPIKKDNCAYCIDKILKEKGLEYEWTWTGAKFGYDIYDEGLAIFFKGKIKQANAFYFSKSHNYNNWKSRKALCVKCVADNKNFIFYNLHMGWWNDQDEPFDKQFDFLQEYFKNHNKDVDNVFLLGDFNSPSNEKNGGYDYVKNFGWKDTYELAQKKDNGLSVLEEIDGWRDNEVDGMRIDYIWSLKEITVTKSEIVFNNINKPKISDHCGVKIEIQ